jgi:hypothetical protein
MLLIVLALLAGGAGTALAKPSRWRSFAYKTRLASPVDPSVPPSERPPPPHDLRLNFGAQGRKNATADENFQTLYPNYVPWNCPKTGC